MTNLQETSAGLVLDEKVSGRVYVRDAHGRLLVELRKEPLTPVELGLPPGEYRVNIDDDGRPLEARVTLVEGRRFRLTTGELRPEVALATTRRGGPADAAADVGGGRRPCPSSYRDVPFEAVLAPGVRSGGSGLDPVLNNFVLGVVGHSHAPRGPAAVARRQHGRAPDARRAALAGLQPHPGPGARPADRRRRQRRAGRLPGRAAGRHRQRRPGLDAGPADQHGELDRRRPARRPDRRGQLQQGRLPGHPDRRGQRQPGPVDRAAGGRGQRRRQAARPADRRGQRGRRRRRAADSAWSTSPARCAGCSWAWSTSANRCRAPRSAC